MKKRVISLLLCFSILFGVAVPAMTPQADAFIGKLIMTGVKMSASIVKSCVNVCKNQDDYNGNVGKAVGALFKGAAEDFLGTSFGGDDKPAGTGESVVIQQVDLSQVEASLSAINTTLEKQEQAVYQLESTVTKGIQDLSGQLDEISSKIDKLGTQVEDSTKLLQYNTYLDTFFDFFNQYYEALSYYDEQVNAMLNDGNYTEEYQKNLFDRFYQLQDVEYSGNFHSAVDKLGRYLQGNYISSSPGSIVDVLSQYYITAYTLLGETDPKVKAASATEDMIGYLFYAYVMGTYYEQAIAMYQTAVITESGTTYKTDFNTLLSQTSIDATIEKLWISTQTTVGCILRDLINNYPTSTSMPVVYQISTGEVLNRTVPQALINAGTSPDTVFHVEPGATFWLQDPVAALSNFDTAGSGYFSEEFCEAFTGITPYQSTEYIDTLNNYCLHVKDGIPIDQQIIQAKLGNTTVYTVTVKPYYSDFLAGDGTEDYPYLIQDKPGGNSAESQLDFIFGETHNGYDDTNDASYGSSHFVLGQDVNMRGKEYTGLSNFSGSFDGNGYTLSNFILGAQKLPEDNLAEYSRATGLFGTLTGTVRNLKVEGGQFKVNPVVATDTPRTGTRVAGILAGTVENGGTLEYCQVKNCSVDLTLRRSAEGNSADEQRNLITGGAVGCVGNGGTLDTVVVIDTSVNANTPSTAWSEVGLSGKGQAIAGGLAGALAENGSISRCSYNQTENFSASGRIYAESQSIAIAGFLIGLSEAKSEDQTAHCWLVLDDYPHVSGKRNMYSNYGIGRRKNDDIFPAFVYKMWNPDPDDPYRNIFQDNISVKTITDYYAKLGLSDGLDLSTFRENDDDDILELYFREPCDDLMTPPNQLNYAVGDYLNLSGYRVYQTVGRCKLSTEFRYTSPYVNSGSGHSIFHLNIPLDKTINEIKFFYPTEFTAVGSITTGPSLNVKDAVHAYVVQTLKQVTCTEAGETQQLCLLCGDQKEPETIEPPGHNKVVTKEGYPATCTKDGLTDEESCSRCGEIFSKQTVIPSPGHQTETTTVLEPSCVSGGVKQEKCTVCGEIIKLENIDALGHDYQAVVTDPTCKNPGYTTHTCTRCGDSYTDSYTAPTDHHYGSGVVTREPTCTEEGEMTYTCTCGETHTEPIPTIDHDYTPIVTAPTCTEMGYTTHTCTQCGDSYVDTYTVPNGHNWNEGETVTPPTLIATGLLHQRCTVCDEEQETVIPALTSCDGGMDCPSRKFTDVAGIEDWSHIGIDYVLRSCIFYGTSATEFSPNAPMTRAMLVAVLYRMDGNTSVDGMTHPFQDVPADCWYEDALIWAYNNGIVSGTSTTTFEPDSNTTRQQIAAILYRYAGFKGYDVSASADLTVFPDHGAIADYAMEPLAWANAAGLIQGSLDGAEPLLLPTRSATRAQLAAILMRFMKNVAK